LPDDHDFSVGNKFGDYQDARAEFHEIIGIYPDNHPRFRASFSDCAYLIYDEPRELLFDVRRMMHRFYQIAPIRGGIGKGNFGFGKTIHTSDGRFSSTESSFFGSAIIRAHAAEDCGLKGFRVFVHPSAVPDLLALQGNVTVYRDDYQWWKEPEAPSEELPATVVPLSTPSSSVTHELCFLGDDKVVEYFRWIDKLRTRFPPNDNARIHYDDSLATLQRFEEMRSLVPKSRSPWREDN
jgi:hypothetical protein